MIEPDQESQATALCKACGLCCSGHLFTWVKLRSAEIGSAKTLGIHVLGPDPRQRGFNQPCPLWNGECSIHNSPAYPRSCKTYQCKLLKKLLDGTTTLADALTVIQATKERIRVVTSLLPASSSCNFRERLAAHHGSGRYDPEFERQALDLLHEFKEQFGVKDIIELSDER